MVCVSQYLSLLQKRLCPRALQKKIERWFIITDKEKVIWYLEKVWLHRLRKYFNVVNDFKWVDFQIIIDSYIFDKSLRNINLIILESIEKSIKSQFILNFKNINNKNLYLEKFRDDRIMFFNQKIDKLKNDDSEIRDIYNQWWKIPNYLLVDKLQFWEIYKIFIDLEDKYKKKIAEYYLIDYVLFTNWFQCMVYLRNLCSHWENIFNRKFTYSVKANELFKIFNIYQNNIYISYFYVL